MHVEASTMVKAPKKTVSEIYADYRNWPRLFPTISRVRLLRHDGPKLVLEIDHTEGKVINELMVRSSDEIDLWEEKRRYDARFLTSPGSSSRSSEPTCAGRWSGCSCSQ